MGIHIIPDRTNEGKVIQTNSPFASKKLENGKSLFKRVHGSSATIPANSTASIDLVISYAEVKFSGAEIIGCAIGDTVDFTVHDTSTNTISGLDVVTYGANVELNQFGFGVEMSNDSYSNASNYDASLYQDMILRCTYTNNGNADKYIGVNFELHEVK